MEKYYKKTRYERIYRHEKNKNFIIRIKTPIDTTITKYKGSKILDIEVAKRIRDNPKIALEKKADINLKEITKKEGNISDFDILWVKYMDSCKNIEKQAYNTLLRKQKTYNKYFKEKIDVSVMKTDKLFWSKFINNLDTTDKNKNHILKTIKAFFNWCINEEILIVNPLKGINKYKEDKVEMAFWLPEEIKQFLDTVELYLNSSNKIMRILAYRVKVLTYIGFSLGDRIGETRALTYECIDKDKKTADIFHSINYDTKSNNFFSSTKTEYSKRTIDITDKLIDVIFDYRKFLEVELGVPVKDTDLILFNYTTKRPISDVSLRKNFHKFCELARVRKIRLYDLRHTYVATMMSEGLELYYISPKLGHVNYNTTVNKYGHLSNKKKQQVASLTDKYL